MGRKPRIDYPGAWHHLNGRGLSREPIFRTAKDARTFLALLGDVHRNYGLECHSYALMTNHYHLLVRSAEGNLSKAIQNLISRYTQRFNFNHERDGSVFGGRFHSTEIQGDVQLLNTSRYIHRNPVDAGIVDRADQYRWSSQRLFQSPKRSHDWLQREFLWKVAGGPAQYERFVHQAALTDKRAS